RAHEQPERVAEMRRVEDDEAHAGQHGLLHAGGSFVTHVRVGFMAPRDEGVGFFERVALQAVPGSVGQRVAHDGCGVAPGCRAGAQTVSKRNVNAVRVYVPDGSITLFVPEFVEDGYAWCTHACLLLRPLPGQSVTAPLEALETCFAYFESTPVR